MSQCPIPLFKVFEDVLNIVQNSFQTYQSSDSQKQANLKWIRLQDYKTGYLSFDGYHVKTPGVYSAL